jgi:mannose-P-dolichol utilization defect protein 1
MEPFQCLSNFLKFEFTKDCFSILLSKLLGYSIIFFSLILKAPQIKYLISTKSDEGLSYYSMYFEIILSLTTGLYAYHKKAPLSTYGESIIILIQTFVIILLCWKYTKRRITHFEKNGFLFLINGIIYLCLNEKLTDYQWELVASSSLILVSLTKFTQIYASWKSKSTGSLSMFTFFMAFLGCNARVFTTITEAFDIYILMQYTYGAILNFVIMAQIYIYGKNKVKKE